MLWLPFYAQLKASLGSLATVSNLTGPITSVGAATAVASQTGTGSTFAMSAGPTFTGTVNMAAAVLSGALTVGGALDISGASAGQIKFPATQNASAGANTLDDYEEGTFTPVLTFTAPGNLSSAFSIQTGTYTKIGQRVWIEFGVNTTTWTWTTSSGSLVVTGLPFTATASSGYGAPGAVWFDSLGLSAGRTQLTATVFASESLVRFIQSGASISAIAPTTANAPSGTNLLIRASISYFV